MEADSESTLGERAFRDMMWYFVHFGNKETSLARRFRGGLVAVWVLITFLTRMAFHLLLSSFLDLLKVPSIVRDMLHVRTVIDFDALQKYKYEPLLKSNDIRVLLLYPGHKKDDISCELKTLSLDTPCEYAAISYAWGGGQNEHRIRCGNCAIAVRQNLYLALRQFRHKSKIQMFWADALCKFNCSDCDPLD
jgi:hypothetical protein